MPTIDEVRQMRLSTGANAPASPGVSIEAVRAARKEAEKLRVAEHGLVPIERVREARKAEEELAMLPQDVVQNPALAPPPAATTAQPIAPVPAGIAQNTPAPTQTPADLVASLGTGDVPQLQRPRVKGGPTKPKPTAAGLFMKGFSETGQAMTSGLLKGITTPIEKTLDMVPHVLQNDPIVWDGLHPTMQGEAPTDILTGEPLSFSTDPVFRAVEPEFDRIRAENPIAYGGSEFLGSFLPIGAAIGGASKLGLSPLAAEMAGFGAYEAAREGNPAAALLGMGMGLGFGAGVRGMGPVTERVLAPATKDVASGLGKVGRTVTDRFRGRYKPKPRIKVPTEQVPHGAPGRPSQIGLGPRKSAEATLEASGPGIAGTLGVIFNGVQQASPSGRVPAAMLFTDRVTGSTFAATSREMAARRLTEVRQAFKAAEKPPQVAAGKAPKPGIAPKEGEKPPQTAAEASADRIEGVNEGGAFRAAFEAQYRPGMTFEEYVAATRDARQTMSIVEEQIGAQIKKARASGDHAEASRLLDRLQMVEERGQVTAAQREFNALQAAEKVPAVAPKQRILPEKGKPSEQRPTETTVPEGGRKFAVDPRQRGTEYAGAIEDHAAEHPFGAAVEVKSPAFYANAKTRLYLDKDATAGVAVTADGDLVSVFKRRGSTTNINDLLAEAAPHARTGDAFDIKGMLPDLYAPHGFRPAARLKFNREFAPEGWDYAKLGEPDIVLLVRDVEGASGLIKVPPKAKGGYNSIRDKVPVFEDYDLALKAQQEAVARMTGKGAPEVGVPRSVESIVGKYDIVSPEQAATVKAVTDALGVDMERAAVLIKGGTPAEGAFAQTERLLTGKASSLPEKQKGMLGPVAKYLDTWVQGRKLFPEGVENASDKEIVSQIARHTKRELKAWRELATDYEGFYTDDVARANKALQEWAQAEYGRALRPEEVELFHVLSAFASPGANPAFDSRVGILLLNRYITTGRLSGKGFKLGREFKKGKPTGKLKHGQVSKQFASTSLGKLQRLIDQEGGLAEAMKWIKSEHTAEEMAAFLGVKPKHLTGHEYLSREAGGFGAFAVSQAKLGSYILNRLGNLATITKDMWWTRTMARFTGEPLVSKTGEVAGKPPNLTKKTVRMRALADEAWRKVGKDLGLEPAEVQQQMWDFEKRLWARLGHAEPTAAITTGVKRGVSALGKMKGEPDVLWQRFQARLKASVEFPAEGGPAIIRAFKGSDVSSAFHEEAHVIRRLLFDRSVPQAERPRVSDADIEIMERAAGVRDGIWERGNEEWFARAVERYLYDGVAPTEELRPIFAKIKEWMRKIYQNLKESEIDIEISPEVRNVFDKAFGAKPSGVAEARAQLVKRGVPRAEAHRQALSLKNAATDQIYREYPEMGKAPEGRKRGWEVSITEASEAGLDQRALEIAGEVVKSRRPISAEESMGLLLKRGQLEAEAKKLSLEMDRLAKAKDEGGLQIATRQREELLEQIDLVSRAAKYGGTELSLGLGIRRAWLSRESFDIVTVLREARAAKGTKLTKAEQEAYTDLVGKYEAAEKRIAEMEVEYAAALAEAEKRVAGQVIARATTKSRIRAKAGEKRQTLKAEREDLKKKIAAKGYRLNTGVDPEALYYIGRLAVNWAQEGYVTMDKIVRLVIADFPELTASDVHRAIASKNPKAQRRARSAAEKRVTNLKKQAKLLVAIEDAEQGIFAPGRKKPVEPHEIQKLRKQLRDLRASAYRSGQDARRLEKAMQKLNELQDQLANHYRDVKKKQPLETEELKARKEEIKKVRQLLKVEDDLADVTEQLRTKDYKPRERPVVLEEPVELQKQRIKLARARKLLRQAIREQEAMTRREKFGQAVSTGRTLLTIGDMSSTGRQNVMLVSRRVLVDPLGLGKDFGKSVAATFSKEADERIHQSIINDAQHWKRERAGLEITEDVGPLTTREEFFRSNILTKIPVVRDVVGASERHFRTFSNLMRADAFDRFLNAVPNATARELEIMASAINIFSGRGDLGKAAAIANEMGTVIFAPRFSFSRVQTVTLKPLLASLRNPRVRAEIVKQYASFVGVGMVILRLAHLSGFEVGLDPEDADFGKIKVGNTRVDIWGGFQQPARIIARVIGGGVRIARGRDADVDPLELIYRFSSYKLSPPVTLGSALFTGKDIIGRPVTPGEAVARGLIPLILQDAWEAGQDAGYGRAAMAGGLAFFGVGVNTYRKRQRGGLYPTPPTPKFPRPPRIGVGR